MASEWTIAIVAAIIIIAVVIIAIVIVQNRDARDYSLSNTNDNNKSAIQAAIIEKQNEIDALNERIVQLQQIKDRDIEYQYHRGKDSYGNDIMTSIKPLDSASAKQICSSLDGCKGFHLSDDKVWYKHTIKQPPYDEGASNEGGGLYVAQ